MLSLLFFDIFRDSVVSQLFERFTGAQRGIIGRQDSGKAGALPLQLHDGPASAFKGVVAIFNEPLLKRQTVLLQRIPVAP